MNTCSLKCGSCDECCYYRGRWEVAAERDAEAAKIKMTKTIVMTIQKDGSGPDGEWHKTTQTFQFEDDLTDPQIEQLMQERQPILGRITIIDATPTEKIKSRGTDVLVIRSGGDVLRFKFNKFITNEEIHRRMLVDGTLTKFDTDVRIIPTPVVVTNEEAPNDS